MKFTLTIVKNIQKLKITKTNRNISRIYALALYAQTIKCAVIDNIHFFYMYIYIGMCNKFFTETNLT